MTQERPRRTSRVQLRLLGLSDVHGHVLSYNYLTDGLSAGIGLARLAPLIRHARATCPNTLLFDNGDTLQGTALTDWAAHHLSPGQTHPMVAALNQLGVDAANLGNHDFNYGIGVMQQSYAGALFPVVCANAVRARGRVPGEDETLLPPWRVIFRDVVDTSGASHQLKIGVIGVLPPQIVNWDHQHLQDHIEARGIVETVAAHLPQIRAAADVVVVLCHSGLGDAVTDPSGENAASAVAALPGVDAVIAGHSHRPFPGPSYVNWQDHDIDSGTVHGTPLALPGAMGADLGVIDLTLVRRKSGWRVIRGRARLWPRDLPKRSALKVSPLEDPDLGHVTATAHHATRTHLAQVVGTTPTRLHTYFAMLDPGPAQALVAQAQTCAVRDLLAGTDLAGLPILASVSPFKCGGRAGPEFYTDVPAGPLTLRHLTDLYLFPNSLRAMLVTGADLRLWLERSAGAFRQILPGIADQPLIDRALAGYDFDTIFGLTYRFDLTQPSRYDPARGTINAPDATRIIDLAWKGQPLRDQDRFIVSTNSYRAGGGGNFPGVRIEDVVAETPATVRDLMARYVAECDQSATPAQVWSLAPIPGATVILETSPLARSAPEDIARLGLSDQGDRADGFALFSLSLSEDLG